MSQIIACRLGRQVVLNGDDEYLHKADIDIDPAGGLDLGASDQKTIAIFAEVAYAENGTRRVLFAKRLDPDPAASSVGYMLYRDDDDTVKFLLDDGTTTLVVPIGLELIDDGYGHVIVLKVDRVNDELVAFASPGKDHRAVTKLGTFDISTVANSAGNGENFALGAQYDGTVGFTASNIWKGGIAWSAWWQGLLTDTYCSVLGRFDFAPPNPRKMISLWHFSQRNSDDWNRTNANDLIEVGIVAANYQQGPERFLDIASITTTPSMGERAGTASVDFIRFKPFAQQEGRFFEVGSAGAPPLRIRRSTRGAADPLDTALGVTNHCTIYGAYASFQVRGAGGEDPKWALYDVRVNENPGDDETPVPGWEPIGVINGDADFGASCEIWDSDGKGVPDTLYGFGNTVGDFLEVDVSDPTAPSKLAAVNIPGRNTNQVLRDRRAGVDFCYLYDQNGQIMSVDISTAGAPVLDDTLSDTRLQPSYARMVQVGTRLYVTSSIGIAVIDISNPSAMSFVDDVVAGPDSPNNDSPIAIVITASGNLATAGNTVIPGGSVGALHTWSLADPDQPELVKREVHADYFGGFHLMRRGNILFLFTLPGAASLLVAIGEPDPLNLGRLARYVLSDYDPTIQNVETHVDLDRDSIALLRGVSGGTGGGWLFKCDDGYGQVSYEADYPIPSVAVANPVPAWEYKYLVHDLSLWDFEGQTPGDPPAGFAITKDDAASSAEISTAFALTGQPPGSPVLPSSCELAIGGAGTQVGIVATMLAATDFIDVADFGPGETFPITFWYYVDGAGAFDATTDIRCRIQETGGVLSTDVSFFGTYSEADRWYRVELDYQWVYADSTGAQISFELLNATGVTVYIDTCRAGPGKIYPLVSGRVMSAQAGGATNEGKALVYGVELLDNTFDLNRTPAAEERREAEPVKDLLDYLIATYTRAIDEFDTNNVLELPDPENEFLIEADEALGPLFTRAVTAGRGQWSLRDRSVFAFPPGYEAAPHPLNDVVWGFNPDFADREDGGELVTDLDVRGDRGLSNPPTASFNDDDLRSQYGPNAYGMDYNEDIATDAQAANVRDLKRGLLGHTQLEGSVSFINEPRFRPSQIIPLQIDVRGYDEIVMVADVSHKVNDGGQLVTTIGFRLLQQELIDLLFPDSDSADQAKTKAFVDDAVSASAWNT